MNTASPVGDSTGQTLEAEWTGHSPPTNSTCSNPMPRPDSLLDESACCCGIFLPVLFLVIAFASYKFGQVGARQVPYAYYLLGLTTLTVATDGVTDPAQAWGIGLDRSE